MSKFLDIEEKARRKPHSYTLLPSNIERVREAAELHNTSASRIVEALIVKFLPAIIEQAKKEAASA